MKPEQIPETQKVALANQVSDSVDAIEIADYPTPRVTSPKDVIIKNIYGGVNFIDSYFRKGIYKAALPIFFGKEASGTVVAIGDQVTNFKIGDKVAYMAPGTLAQYTKVNDNTVTILNLGPAVGSDDLRILAASLLQGLTAMTFIDMSYEVKKGDFVLIWAASGGVGKILTQLVAMRGARGIAVASADEKLRQAKELGAEFTINYRSEKVLDKVLHITGGEGVQVSYDSVGRETFEVSLASLCIGGTLVSYGNSSGVVPPISITLLTEKNIKLLRPTVMSYIAKPDVWRHYTDTLRTYIKRGDLKIDIGAAYFLREYKYAMKALESGTTTGKIIIDIPQE